MDHTTKWPRQFSRTNPKIKPIYFQALLELADLTAAALARKMGLAPATVQRPCRVGGSLELLKRYAAAVNVELWRVMTLGKEMELAAGRMELAASKMKAV